MPRKISELKQFVSKKSLENIKEDPSQNSVLGNVKKLNDFLGDYNDVVSNQVKSHLTLILDSFEGKTAGGAPVAEQTGDNGIVGIEGALHGLYLMKTQSSADRIADEKKRSEIKNLIEYVAAGLGLEDNIRVSEEQKANVKAMEDQGKTEVAKEREAAEKQAQKESLEAKSGLNVLDEHKAAIGALPKKFRGPQAGAEKAEAHRQLKLRCLDIMATRRSIDAKRNDKDGLSKSRMSADLLDTVRKDMAKSEALAGFLDSMSYEDLRSLAYDGHGGKMEEKFADHLRKNPSIPADAPAYYMPTAKAHIEALQDKMDGAFRRQTPPGEQRKLYIELMATRAAVNSKRNAKETLNPQVNPQYLEQERQKFREEPLNTALVRLTSIDDDVKRDITCDAAKSGHGGALEDLVRKELRTMALEKESEYKMQNVDRRYAPTYEERRGDLRKLIDSGQLSVKEQFRASVEHGVLGEMSQKDNNTADTRIGNVESVNRQTQMQVDLYSRMMDEESMREFVKRSGADGYDAACGWFEGVHAGELKAINLAENLDKQLASEAPKEDLSRLAAKKMILMQRKAQFRNDKDNAALADALEDKKLNKDVDTLLEKDYNFKLMVKKLGSARLREQAAGDGAKLFESYNLEKQDKLDEQLAKEKAPVINGPKKNDPQAGGPAVNGPVA
ncbi:MAG: hypothetical protein K5772_04180 [Clostridia bacterium]|nr:hypothetical protein [Clostridia bacterium]